MSEWRIAFRELGRARLFSAVVLLTLALGIGANTAIFSFVDALLLAPLPFDDPDQLVRIVSVRGERQGTMSTLDIDDIRRESRLIAGVASFRLSQYNVTGGGAPAAIPASINSYNLFSLLGARTVAGSTWPKEHDRARVFAVVLGYDVWKTRYNGDRSIVGRSVILDGAPYTVLGVLAPGFAFPGDAGIYRRVPPGDFDDRAIRESSAVARLREGVTLAQAQAELDALASRLEARYPRTNRGVRFVAQPLRELWIGNAGPYLVLLSAAVALVLLIACVNVVNLMLVRASTRDAEMATRLALGASRRAIVAQLLRESFVLSLAGGAVGTLLAFWAVRVLRDLFARELPPFMEIAVNERVLVATSLLALAVGVIAGLAPALQSAATDLTTALRGAAKGVVSTDRGYRLRRILIAGEIALALMLLVAAGSIVRGFLALRDASLGFEPAGVLTMKIDPPWTRFKRVEDTAPFYKRVIEEIERLPGVVAASTNDALPLAGSAAEDGFNRQAVTFEGQSLEQIEQNPYVTTQIVGARWFEAMGIPLLRGRGFTGSDTPATMQVAVVSEALARRIAPDGNVVEKRLRLAKRGANYRPVDPREEPDIPWLTIVGIAANVRHGALASEASLDVYVYDQQTFAPETYLVIRTAQPELAATLAEPVRQAILRVDRDQSAFDVATMSARVDQVLWQQRLAGAIFTLFAALAAVLAAVGIYGVVASLIAIRTREFGIRVAIGARPRDVLTLIAHDVSRLVATGLGVGALLTVAVVALLRTTPGMPRIDIASLAFVPALLIAIAAGATAIPARRVARIDAGAALRAE